MRTPQILVSLLLLGLSTLSLLMPWYTRPELFFGITVQREFRRTSAARRLVRGYRTGICAVLVLALAIVLVMQRPVIALYALVLGTFAILIAAHHATSKYASPRDSAVEVDLNAAPEHIPGGAMAAFLPLVWLIGFGLWAASNTARLPSHITTHWGMSGPDRWVATTPESVVVIVALPGVFCLGLGAIAYGILHWSRRISTSGPAASGERQFRRRYALLLLIVEYLLAALPLLMLLGAPQTALRIWLIALWVTLIVFLIQLARAGQGGSRARAAPATPVPGAAPVGDRTDDARWLGGLIYVNPADHALFVERRMGIGWTLNFGSLWAWLLVLGVIAIPLILRIALPLRSSLDTPEARTQAQAAALIWLGSIDAGDYTRSWDTAARLFRDSVPEAQWVSRISAVRGRLGAVRARNVSSTRFRDDPDGEYLVIKYDSRFEHETEATETVTPMMDADGQWRVSGYYIK